MTTQNVLLTEYFHWENVNFKTTCLYDDVHVLIDHSLFSMKFKFRSQLNEIGFHLNNVTLTRVHGNVHQNSKQYNTS